MQGRGSRQFLGRGAAALCLLAAVTMPAAAASPHHRNPLKLPGTQIVPATFAELEGWSDDNQAQAFGAFLKSCKAILASTKAMRASNTILGGLYEVCGRAVKVGDLDDVKARAFFEENFKPVRISKAGEAEGFLTGYYESVVDGAKFPSDEYKIPVYAKPSNLVMPKNGKGRPGRRVGRKGKTVPYYDRTEIEDGVLAGRGLEICWVKNPVDAFFAQIQGSARIKLDTGSTLRLNYDAHNGMPYTPVGKFLIQRGIVSKEEMSMDKIREYMEKNPKEGDELRRQNHSFVFFREVPLGDDDQCIGAQGIPLTPGRSLAMDKNIHIYGTPFWIDAKLPIASEKPETPFRRLLVAQDTGSAITGPARADIYFGVGEDIGHIAGRIKQFGKFVMLVPGTVPIGEEPQSVPLPKPRPALVAAKSARAADTPAETAAPVAVPKPRPKT